VGHQRDSLSAAIPAGQDADDVLDITGGQALGSIPRGLYTHAGSDLRRKPQLGHAGNQRGANLGVLRRTDGVGRGGEQIDIGEGALGGEHPRRCGDRHGLRQLLVREGDP